MLQRLTEDLEYSELLDRAARCDSSLEQMCLVAAFSVSSYSTTVHRTAKPFNPLLGETYELDRLEEFGYRSISEQVPASHAPSSLMQSTEMRIQCDACTRPLRSVITRRLLRTTSPQSGDGPCGSTSLLIASSVGNTFL